MIIACTGCYRAVHVKTEITKKLYKGQSNENETDGKKGSKLFINLKVITIVEKCASLESMVISVPVGCLAE
jgi:hypothetical protein